MMKEGILMLYVTTSENVKELFILACNTVLYLIRSYIAASEILSEKSQFQKHICLGDYNSNFSHKKMMFLKFEINNIYEIHTPML